MGNLPAFVNTYSPFRGKSFRIASAKALSGRTNPRRTLFRETEVAQQLLAAIFALDYPHDRLDIKLVLEADDLATRALIRNEELPDHVEVIVVPAGGPQTKPKALNYALQFARGELITVFDAEDLPDEDELRLAAEIFATAPPNCACLQARLLFHNDRENWLTSGIMAQTPQAAGRPPCLG